MKLARIKWGESAACMESGVRCTGDRGACEETTFQEFKLFGVGMKKEVSHNRSMIFFRH